MPTFVTSSAARQTCRTTLQEATPQPNSLENVIDLFESQVAAAPQAMALINEAQTISYGELDRRSNQLANYLIAAGVGPETIVGLCLNRSLESVLCAIAVLKAGGAYLPLDPAYPTERLTVMLNDARPRVVITTGDSVTKLPDVPIQFIDLDSDKEIEEQSEDAPSIKISGDQLAYVIYTSGSTGQPKGVEVTHDSLMNLVTWHREEFAVRAADRASHLASVGFDAAVWEVWPYLSSGASLYLPTDETRLSPELLRDWLVQNEITISFLPTVLAERVMILKWPEQSSLRYLLTGADTLHRYPTSGLPFTLINNYGPTECTVVATSGRIKAGDEKTGLPNIGRPIANTLAYILNDKLEQVESGAVGEIYIGGRGVARGYLNRPELTSERFVRNPFDDDFGSRLYRTGDLGRYLENGEIAYVGRADEQIKLFGYRIEPTEIEAAIDRHAAIASSVVIARGATCDEKRLTAYLTTRNGTTPAATEMRSFLRDTLPDYMVPAIFVKLPCLPLTANGKVDRSALPEPSIENTLRDDDFTAPRSPIEKRLAKILCGLLNLNDVSVNDNFFLLGGHSLLGTQLIVKIRSSFGVDLSLRTLFDAPTIAELSSEIERLIIARVQSMSEDEARALLA